LSFSFDDARESAARIGAGLLEEHGWRATFFVLMEHVRAKPRLWRRLARAGHEIGNHTIEHPCSGNFPWSRENPLEEYTLSRMAAELDEASGQIEAFFGRWPTSFAYCCGQKYVGRGTETRSYVPLVAERFAVGRGARDEYANDPLYVDLAQVGGIEADGLGTKDLIALVEQAADREQWLVLVGHEVATAGLHAVGTRELETFCRWLRDRRDIWVAPIAEIGAHIARSRAPRATVASSTG
jgi:peptidoglycan-N-acetylglucosamine deacetylase